MSTKRNSNPETSKPATPAERRAVSQSTKDGLQKTRENTSDRTGQ
jgi:hypothetical protein